MKTAVCIASGISLTKEDVDYCQGKAAVYVVNNCYKLAPWADVLYACDEEWWDHYKPEFAGQKWTINEDAGKKYNLNIIPHDTQALFCTENMIATGNNSGFQAINLAYLHGYRRILLLGYDYQNSGQHWHGRHGGHLNKSPDMRRWIRHMDNAYPLMVEAGLTIINCSRDTAITSIPRSNITQEL